MGATQIHLGDLVWKAPLRRPNWLENGLFVGKGGRRLPALFLPRYTRSQELGEAKTVSARTAWQEVGKQSQTPSCLVQDCVFHS